ncbi:hypothetical protein ACWESM_18555 [Nocardia sp. NPDC003999]
MSVPVIRHRGGGYDDDGNPIPWVDHPLEADAVAPGPGSPYADRARDGETVARVVYFRPAVDLTERDELTVDGRRYRLEVDQWRPRRGRASRTGTVAICTAREG